MITFETLPAEVRLRIYKHLFFDACISVMCGSVPLTPGSDTSEASYVSYESDYDTVEVVADGLDSAILYTSKMIYREARPVLAMTIEFGAAGGDLSMVDSNIREFYYPLIRYIDSDAPSWQELDLKPFLNLRKITVRHLAFSGISNRICLPKIECQKTKDKIWEGGLDEKLKRKMHKKLLKGSKMMQGILKSRSDLQRNFEVLAELIAEKKPTEESNADMDQPTNMDGEEPRDKWLSLIFDVLTLRTVKRAVRWHMGTAIGLSETLWSGNQITTSKHGGLARNDYTDFRPWDVEYIAKLQADPAMNDLLAKYAPTPD